MNAPHARESVRTGRRVKAAKMSANEVIGQSAEEEIVMTPLKSKKGKILRIERVPGGELHANRVHYAPVEGPHSGIVVNRATNARPNKSEPNSIRRFTAHIHTNDKSLAKEIRELRFWFKPDVSCDVEEETTSFFRQLLNPAVFPKDYLAFVKCVLTLVKVFRNLHFIELEIRPFCDSDSTVDLRGASVVSTTKPLLRRVVSMSDRPPRKPATSLGEPASDGEIRKHLAKARKTRSKSQRKTISNFETTNPDAMPTVFIHGRGSYRVSQNPESDSLRSPLRTPSTDVEIPDDPQFEYVSDYDEVSLAADGESVLPAVVRKKKSLKKGSKPEKHDNGDLDYDDVFSAGNLDYVGQISEQVESQTSKRNNGSVKKALKIKNGSARTFSRVVTDIDDDALDNNDLSLEATDANFHPIETSSMQEHIVASDVENGAGVRKVRKKRGKSLAGNGTKEIASDAKRLSSEVANINLLLEMEDSSPELGKIGTHALDAKPPRSSRRKTVEGVNANDVNNSEPREVENKKSVVNVDSVYLDLLSDNFCPNFIQLEAAHDKNLISATKDITNEKSKRTKAKNKKLIAVNNEEFVNAVDHLIKNENELVENEHIKTSPVSQEMKMGKSPRKKVKESKTSLGELSENKFNSVPTDLDNCHDASGSENDTVNLVLEPVVKSSKKQKNQTVVVYSVKEQFVPSTVNGCESVSVDCVEDYETEPIDRMQSKRRSVKNKKSNRGVNNDFIEQAERLSLGECDDKTGQNGSEFGDKLNGTTAFTGKNRSKSLPRLKKKMVENLEIDDDPRLGISRTLQNNRPRSSEWSTPSIPTTVRSDRSRSLGQQPKSTRETTNSNQATKLSFEIASTNQAVKSSREATKQGTSSSESNILQSLDLPELPYFHDNEQPSVAVISSLECEKRAIDSMWNVQTTFVRRGSHGDDHIFTIGFLDNLRVVSTQLVKTGRSAAAMDEARSLVAQLLGSFRALDHVLFVGVGGAIGCYDVDQVRLGDVIISKSSEPDGAIYLLASAKRTTSAAAQELRTRVWTCPNNPLTTAIGKLFKTPKKLAKMLDAYIVEGTNALNMKYGDTEEYNRPPSSQDVLYRMNGKIEVFLHHPPVIDGSARSARRNMPLVHFGSVATGKLLITDDEARMELARAYQMKAVDSGFEEVLDALELGGVRSYALIRGAADYLDGRSRHKDWRPYAALTAAAAMKWVLLTLYATENRN